MGGSKLRFSLYKWPILVQITTLSQQSV